MPRTANRAIILSSPRSAGNPARYATSGFSAVPTSGGGAGERTVYGAGPPLARAGSEEGSVADVEFADTVGPPSCAAQHADRIRSGWAHRTCRCSSFDGRRRAAGYVAYVAAPMVRSSRWAANPTTPTRDRICLWRCPRPRHPRSASRPSVIRHETPSSSGAIRDGVVRGSAQGSTPGRPRLFLARPHHPAGGRSSCPRGAYL